MTDSFDSAGGGTTDEHVGASMDTYREDVPTTGGVEAGTQEAEGVATESAAVQEAEARRESERVALSRVFALVRVQSADGQLVAPVDWAGSDLIPASMDDEDFEMFLYDFLEDQKAQAAQSSIEAEQSPVYRSATRAVGVPRMFVEEDQTQDETVDCREGVDDDTCALKEDSGDEADARVSDDVQETQPQDSAVSSDDAEGDPLPGFEIPEGFELVELEGELTLVPIDETADDDALACEDITVLVGKHNYYLYSNTIMTDAYAHWAFLAREDDRIITFVDCVRTESRTYPRPMAASGLKNEPFSMTDEEIEQTWNVLHESGEYPDIEVTVASNGEVYYYSTEHLSPAYAASLAEWHAVERALYL